MKTVAVPGASLFRPQPSRRPFAEEPEAGWNWSVYAQIESLKWW